MLLLCTSINWRNWRKKGPVLVKIKIKDCTDYETTLKQIFVWHRGIKLKNILCKVCGLLLTKDVCCMLILMLSLPKRV